MLKLMIKKWLEFVSDTIHFDGYVYLCILAFIGLCVMCGFAIVRIFSDALAVTFIGLAPMVF